MTRSKPGQPSPWSNVPSEPIRLPKVFHPVLIAAAKLLDSGAIAPDKFLSQITAADLDPNKTPTLEELTNLLGGITQAIALASGWDLTAAELGLIVSTLEQSAKDIDLIFAEKAKVETMAIASKKKRGGRKKNDD